MDHGREPTAEELAGAGGPVEVVRAAVAAHHVLEVRYRTAEGVEETLKVDPISIRVNRTGHVVLWAWDRAREKILDLWMERLLVATDTGEVFPWPHPKWDGG